MSNPYLPPTASASSSSTYTPPPTLPQQAEPVTRSRTLFYLSVRDTSSFASSSSAGRSRRQYGYSGDGDADGYGDEREGLIGGASSRVDMKGLPPRWVDASDEVEDILNRIKPKIAALDKLHAKHVLPGFTDRTAEEREIERQTTDITRDFRRCTTLISTIQPGRGASRVEVVTAKNVQRGLAQKVQDLSGMFRKKQRVYMQKLQGHAIKNRDLLAASGAISLRGSEMDELADDEAARQADAQLQSQAQAQLPASADVDITRRTAEIAQIASSISELAELFRDLGNMVVEQGTVLDSVEYNVSATAREMGNAVEELQVAQRYQSNTGRRRCILLLILVILGLVLVLIYKPRSRGSSAPASPSSAASMSSLTAGEGVVITASSATSFMGSTSSASFSTSLSASSRSRRPHGTSVRPSRTGKPGLSRPSAFETDR